MSGSTGRREPVPNKGLGWLAVILFVGGIIVLAWSFS